MSRIFLLAGCVRETFHRISIIIILYAQLLTPSPLEDRTSFSIAPSTSRAGKQNHGRGRGGRGEREGRGGGGGRGGEGEEQAIILLYSD